MNAAQLLGLASLPALAAASLHDVAARRVPDALSVLVALCGLGARLASGELLLSLVVALAVFGGLFACWQRGLLGGGDVKLLAACSLLVPPGDVLDLLLAVAMAGGVLACAYLLGRKALLPPCRRGIRRAGTRLGRLCRVEHWRMCRGAPLPYACAIATGCLFTLLRG